MFRALAPRLSPWRRANARNVRFETLYGGQFTLSTQLIIPNYPDILSYRRSTTVSLETCPIYSVLHVWFATFQAVTLDTFSSSCILNHIIMSLKSVHDVVHRSSEHRVSRHDTSGSVLYQEGRTSVGKIR